jgi:hypothetical protein
MNDYGIFCIITYENGYVFYYKTDDVNWSSK